MVIFKLKFHFGNLFSRQFIINIV